MTRIYDLRELPQSSIGTAVTQTISADPEAYVNAPDDVQPRGGDRLPADELTPAPEEAWDETDDMCPNCQTPWKCNGPHEPLGGEA